MLRVLFALSLFSSFSHAQVSLTMDQYLEQVRASNQGHKGLLQNREGAKERSAQAELLTAYRLEGNYQYQIDKKLSQTPALTYDALNIESYSLGIAKTTRFGLDAKLSYDIANVEYENPNVAIPGGTQISTATPTITLKQSLLQNSAGSLTEARIEATSAQAEFERQTSEANLDALMQKATAAYWSLVFQREVVAIQQAGVKQSQTIYEFNSRRSRMNLTDRADTLQARASLESKKLDLQAALDNERSRLREFNLYRNREPGAEAGPLTPLDWNLIPKIALPKTRGDRADVKAARAQATANAANFRITAENARPILDVYGSYALNGRATDYGAAVSDSYSANRPTTTVGVNLSLPLDTSLLTKTQSGARAQAQAAELVYQQKVLEQEAAWQDLNDRVVDAQKRVISSESIVEAQREKLEYERRRLRQGRTSTYQVLLFEQDYINARMTKLQNANELVSLLSQVKLYDDTEESGLK